MSVFNASVLLLTMNFVITCTSSNLSYFDSRSIIRQTPEKLTSLGQYSNKDQRLSGHNGKFVKLLLSFNGEVEVGGGEKGTSSLPLPHPLRFILPRQIGPQVHLVSGEETNMADKDDRFGCCAFIS